MDDTLSDHDGSDFASQDIHTDSKGDLDFYTDPEGDLGFYTVDELHNAMCNDETTSVWLQYNSCTESSADELSNEQVKENKSQEMDKSSTRETFQQQSYDMRQFLDELPLLSSHYCRKNSMKCYLQTDIRSWNQLYLLYTFLIMVAQVYINFVSICIIYKITS